MDPNSLAMRCAGWSFTWGATACLEVHRAVRRRLELREGSRCAPSVGTRKQPKSRTSRTIPGARRDPHASSPRRQSTSGTLFVGVGLAPVSATVPPVPARCPFSQSFPPASGACVSSPVRVPAIWRVVPSAHRRGPRRGRRWTWTVLLSAVAAGEPEPGRSDSTRRYRQDHVSQIQAVNIAGTSAGVRSHPPGGTNRSAHFSPSCERGRGDGCFRKANASQGAQAYP